MFSACIACGQTSVSVPASHIAGVCLHVLSLHRCTWMRWRFLLLNPSTRVSKELPKDPQLDRRKKHIRLLKIGLGWDESSGAYKMFVSFRDDRANYPSQYRSRVYSSKKNSWKTVKNPYSGINGREGRFVGGKLYWLSRNEKTLSSFDLRSEVVGLIDLPVDMNGLGYWRRCVLLGVVGDSLCLGDLYGHATRDLDLWVMNLGRSCSLSISPLRF